MTAKQKKLILIFSKATLSIGLLAFLLKKTDLDQLKIELAKLGLWYFVGAMGLYLLAIGVSSVRWKVLVREKIGLGRLVSLYLIGGFFNNFLPSMVGGDAVKAYFLFKQTGNGGSALASVFMDRYVGFMALLVVVSVSYTAGWNQIQGTAVEWMIPIVVASFFVISIPMWLYRWDWFKKVQRFYEPLMGYKAEKTAVAQGVVLSLVVQVVTILAVHLLARGMGIGIAWYYFYIFVPLTVIITMIPISISGFGLREGAMVYFLGTAGVESHAAISLSLLWYGSVMASNLLGGVEYARTGYVDKKALKDLEGDVEQG